MAFKNAISWFEIPAIDLGRAQKFYETIFNIQMIPFDTPNFQMRMFPVEDMMTWNWRGNFKSGRFLQALCD